jgi:hypothetical protein
MLTKINKGYINENDILKYSLKTDSIKSLF